MTLLDNIYKHAWPAKRCMLVLAGLVLTACAPLDVSTGSAPTVASPVNDAFAAEVAAIAEGTAMILSSPVGENSQVSAGGFYTSALGERCRPVNVISSGTMHRFAVCHGKDGWYTVDSVFEAMLR
ncbi:MAG: hypothetical protein IJB53_10750 [Mailhella sp.]|nr:hypothetical protein [Mailhella sp.]